MLFVCTLRIFSNSQIRPRFGTAVPNECLTISPRCIIPSGFRFATLSPTYWIVATARYLRRTYEYVHTLSITRVDQVACAATTRATNVILRVYVYLVSNSALPCLVMLAHPRTIVLLVQVVLLLQ